MNMTHNSISRHACRRKRQADKDDDNDHDNEYDDDEGEEEETLLAPLAGRYIRTTKIMTVMTIVNRKTAHWTMIEA